MARLPQGSPAGGSDLHAHAARRLMEAASALSLTVGNLAALAELLWLQRSSACQQEMCHDLAQLAPCAAAAGTFGASAATSTTITGQRQLADLTETLLQAQEQLQQFRSLAGHLGAASPHASSPSLALDRGVHPGACSSNGPFSLGPHTAPPSPMSASTTSSEKSTAYHDGYSATLPLIMEEDVHMQASVRKASNESHCDEGADILEQRAAKSAGAKRTRCFNGDRMDGSRQSPRKPKVPINQKQVIVAEPLNERQIPDDGWSWRKYGRKPIKSSPNPRNYFRCSLEDPDQPCLAKKKVEVSKDDKNVFDVTYLGYHNHAAPTKPITISLISQAGAPPIDIGPRDPDWPPRGGPRTAALTPIRAHQTLGPAPATSKASDFVPVEPWITCEQFTQMADVDRSMDITAIFEGQYAGSADVAAAGSGAEDMEDNTTTPSSSKSLRFSQEFEVVDSFFSCQSHAGSEQAHHVLHSQHQWRLPSGETAESDNGFAPLGLLDFIDMFKLVYFEAERLGSCTRDNERVWDRAKAFRPARSLNGALRKRDGSGKIIITMRANGWGHAMIASMEKRISLHCGNVLKASKQTALPAAHEVVPLSLSAESVRALPQVCAGLLRGCFLQECAR
eukprot:SM000421S16088  [mRNA]  locus=s421:15232:22064:- [translate_table: standard]